MKYQDYFTITDCASDEELAEILMQSDLQRSPDLKEDPIMKHAVIQKKRRLIPSLIAAAAAVMVLTVGTAAYITYNKQMVQNYFGTTGEALVSELPLAEPAYYTNGSVGVTVEALLNDGQYGLMLMTLDKLDPSVRFLNNKGHYTWYFVHQYENPVTSSSGIIEQVVQDDENPDRLQLAYRFNIPDNNTACVIRFNDSPDPNPELYHFADGFEDIEIPVDLTPNTERIHMSDKNGKELLLSGFEAVAPYSISGFDTSDMSVTWKNGSEQRIGLKCGAGFGNNKGKQSILSFLLSSDGSNITENEPQGTPDTWYGYIDIAEVASIRIGNQTFYPD